MSAIIVGHSILRSKYSSARKLN